jgi:hypothetical protein
VQAQAELSKDMQVGAQVRKAVDADTAGTLLGGDTKGRGNSMYGDFGLKRNTEGQTAREAVATLGLDYEGSKYVQDDKNNPGKKTFHDTVDDLGVFMIDTVMTKDMLARSQVPLGHDVYAEAQKQGKDAAARNAGKPEDQQEAVPPMLQTDAAGNLTHAFERNRASGVDPRTGMGNSTLQSPELMAAAEADRPGEQVNVVNQEMKMQKDGRPSSAPLAAGAGEDGKMQTQMNLVRPGTGDVVNVANLVPVMNADGTPRYEKDDYGKPKKDDDGNPVPATRWQLNEGMDTAVKDKVYTRVDSADKAARADWAKRCALVDKENEKLAAEGKPIKVHPDEPPPNPELDKWRQDQAAAAKGK